MLNQAVHLPLTPSFLPKSVVSTDESKALDKEFRRYYSDRMLPVARAGISLGLVLVIAVCILDALMMPRAFVEQAFSLRVMTMVIPLSAVLAATFLVKERPCYPT